jgi:peptide/nickel transport system substrate-binding protein
MTNPDRESREPASLDLRTRREFVRDASVLGVSAVGASALLAACGSSSSSSTAASSGGDGNPKHGGRLVAGLTGGGSSDTVSPLGPVTTVDVARVTLLYNTLTGFDTAGGLVRQLAQEMTPNHDATAWTIRLHSGVTFHNGKDLTADDVIYTFQQVTNKKSPGEGAAQLESVDVPGMKRIDKLTLHVPCHKPFATLDQTLAYNYFGIIPVGFDPKHPIGTGPFRYESFTPGSTSTFSRNPNYWVSGLPYLDELVINDFSDETSQVNALLSKEADIVDLLSAPSIQTVTSGGAKVLISNGGGWTPITMRVDSPPFNDVNVRQALRLVVDRPRMLSILFDGHGTVGNDLFSPWDPVYDRSLPQRQQDIDQAKSLLKRSGHEGLTVELVTAPIAQAAVNQAQEFAQQASAAGIHIKLRQVTTTEFYGPNYLKWPFAQDYWGYDFYFPQVGQGMLPTSPYNETHWNDPKYESLYAQGLRTTDPSQRAEIAHEMQSIEYNSGGYIIPYFPPVIDAYASHVHGVKASRTGVSFNNWDLQSVWID